MKHPSDKMSNQKLYILPFDHRGSFIKMFGLKEPSLSEDDTARLSDYKRIIYEGFLEALAMGVSKEHAAILVDEQFGASIHKDAKEKGITRILTTEKSGQDEFDFEYGKDFGAHIKALAPEYVKVLVRYNTEGNAALNLGQMKRLKIINDFCHKETYKFLFELLVPPTQEQLAKCANSEEVYEKTMRGKLMKSAMKELQDGGIEPDVWKLEGLENPEDMSQVAEQGRSKGRSHVGIVVLGRGESDEKVKKWLKAALGIPGIIGFAVGRTVFKKALTAHHEGKLSRKETSAAIAKNYKSYVDLFEGV